MKLISNILQTLSRRKRPLSDGEIAELVEFSEAEAYADTFHSLLEATANDYDVEIARVGQAYALISRGISSGTTHRVIGLGVSQPATEAQVDDLFGLYEPYYYPLVINLSPYAQPPQLEQWLIDRGMEAVDGVWMFLRESTSDPFTADVEGLEVRQVGYADKTLYARTIVEGFGEPGARVSTEWRVFHEAPIGRPNWRHYLVLKQGEAVAASAMYIQRRPREKVAYLFSASTLIEARRQGANRLLLSKCIGDAETLGCRWITADTGNEWAEHNLVEAGFRKVYLRFHYAYHFT